MSATHHVFGPALIYATVGASLGGLNLLGATTDGGQIDIEEFNDPIMDDRAGPRISTDEQRMGAEGTITCDMIWYNETERSELFSWAQQGLTTPEGTLGYAGVLFGLNSLYYSLAIQTPYSPTGEDPWFFYNVRLNAGASTKLGTVKNIWRMVWEAKNNLSPNGAGPNAITNPLGAQPTSLYGSVLYARSIPS